MINIRFARTVGRCLALCFFISLIAGAGTANAEQAVFRSPDMLALQGSWVRTDSPYVIKLQNMQDGSLQATYFNPRPINVGKTNVAEQDGLVQVLIELQDVNYPGSTYVLTYNRKQDLLQGIYFHPVSKQSYDVAFVRQVAKK